MRILITGSDGFTGSRYCLTAREEGHEVLGTDVKNTFRPEGCRIERLDIRDEQACQALFRDFRPEAVIHTARAPGSLWGVEKDRETAFDINVRGAMNLARCARDLDAAFIFLSSDWVFSGGKPMGRKYREEDEGGPVNYYGVTKWIAEQDIRHLKSRWLILRPAHIYGFHGAVLSSNVREGTSLLEGSVWANVGRALEQGKTIRVPDDMFQTPVYVNHMVETTLELLAKDLTGVFHLADRDCVSRYDITKTVLQAAGLESKGIEKGVAGDFARIQGFPEELFTAMPKNTCLSVEKIEKTLGRQMMTFEEGTACMAGELKGLGVCQK